MNQGRGLAGTVHGGVTESRPLTTGLRRLLVVAGFLVLGTGLILTIFAEDTDDVFAWAITPPMTTAFLGAGYLSSFAFQLVAARQRAWAAARVAVPATLVFTTLTTIATFRHLDHFQLDSSSASVLLVTWAWLVIYVAVPPAMAFLLVRQLRVRGGDPPRRARFGPAFRVVLALQSLVMLVLGVALFVSPLSAGALWPWELGSLTGQAVGAWLVGLGVGGAHSLRENDWARVRPTAAGNLGLGVLHLIALARFGDDLDWDAASAWLYTGFVASMLAVGVYASAQVARLRRDPAA